MRTFNLSQFQDVAYDFESSPLVAVSRAAAFINLNLSGIKILFGDSYYRVSFFRNDVAPSLPVVYVAKLCRPRMRTGVSFSNDRPDYLLQSVFDYIQQFV